MIHEQDTIAAISTPAGYSGIGIVRLSGEKALDIAERVFQPKTDKGFEEFPNRCMIYGNIQDENGQAIDEVLLVKMKAPNTYTKEDVVEINCHGGMVSVQKILYRLIEKGARLAEPGEFTKRAFLNGRIDLTQAEAVIDVINAKTERSLKLSMNQLEGSLSHLLKGLREKLVEILAHIEAGIDYPEYDIETMSIETVRSKGYEIKKEIEQLIQKAQSGRILKEGIKTAIIGKPNVGKSSLMNALLGQQRAIVTEIEGTTRDTIEEVINIKGIALNIIDTAGIRETEDLIERIGIDKTKEILAQSDFVLTILDGGKILDENDKTLLHLSEGKNGIVIINKIDQEQRIDKKEIEKRTPFPIHEISAMEDRGIEELKDIIYHMISTEEIENESYELVSNMRHIRLLEEALQSLTEGLSGIDAGIEYELFSVDIKEAWDKLGKITGETVSDTIIDEILSRFCLGK